MRVLLIILTILFCYSLFAQKVRYEDRARGFFGVNTGVTWHTSDVENDEYKIRGAGFIFGVALNEDYGKQFSFDLRFRGLFGGWRGLDSDTLGMLSSNTALNNLYDSQGQSPETTIQNFQSRQVHWGLELAVHANRLRERTGVDPYIFGGISLTHTTTRGNFLNSSNELYDYSTNPFDVSLNNDYETPLDMNADGDPYPESPDERRSSVMPNFGFGLGYYFTNRFSIGLEHKTTYFGGDYFDGTIVNQNGAINNNSDLYHYTGAYLRFYFKKRERNSSSSSSSSAAATTTPTPTRTPRRDIDAYSGRTPSCDDPKVKFTSPNENPFQTNVQSLVVRAEIENVSSADNIRFTQNGRTNHNFSFNALTNRFQANVTLENGENTFRVRGSNDCGSESSEIIITYREREPESLPPVVTITSPSSNPHTTTNETRKVVARIQNVSDRSNVSFTLNGQSGGNNFTFTPTSTTNFTTEVNLSPGANIIKITATNDDGSDSDETTIIYRKVQEEPNVEPPIVNFQNPSRNNRTVSSPNFSIEGTVENVKGRNQVAFRQNGSNNSNFNFNANNSKFQSNVILKPGSNIFQLSGTNSAGSDSKTIVINYDEPSPQPPIVTITNPDKSPHTTNNANRSVTASILNVTNASQIQMQVNGDNYTQFNFNASKNTLTSVVPLQVGSNSVRITATNDDGSDLDQTIIVYRKPITDPAPVVNIITPSSSPSEVNESKQEVVATVDHVSIKSQVNVNVNGKNLSNFDFNANQGIVTFDANLMLGANTVTVTASNNVGSDSKSTTIIYRKPEEKHPPVVTFIDPVQNPTTVYSSTKNIEAKVEHVNSKNDISVRINGVSTNNFTYSTSNERVNFTTSLVKGANLVQITGTNEHGQDVSTTSIIYDKQDPINPPVVTITTPTQSTYSVSTSSTPIVATVLNVAGKNDIQVEVNGNQTSNFSYNSSSKVLSFTMSLNEGSNDVLITGYNSSGSAQDNRTIVYNKEEEIEPPMVNFLNPENAGKVVTKAHFNMLATVDNVESKNDITLKFDGNTIGSSNYSFNTATKELSYHANLSFGNNIFEIVATNPAGSDASSTNVVYEEPEPECDEPSVSFVNPNQNINVENDSYNVKALVHNVSGNSDITLLLNGVDVGNFSYSSSSHELNRKLDLSTGNNIIEIKVETDCGSTSDLRIINHQPPVETCEKPIVDLISPNSTGFKTQNSSVNVSASVSNVDNVQQLQFRVNGVNAPYNFDAGTHMITATVQLQKGMNDVKIIANNECGSVYDEWQLEREECKEPVISLNLSPDKAETENDNATLSGTITESSSEDITLMVNGSGQNFTYNQSTQNFNSSFDLNEGNNTIVVSSSNECGEKSKSFNITYAPKVVVEAPVVTITDPSNSPKNTENGTYNVKADIQNISSSSQISVNVNNSSKSFNFDASSGKLNFNLDLSEGNNDIEIIAVNDGGMDDDNKTIVYTLPEVVEPPVVEFTNPNQVNSEFEDGTYNIAGNVKNIESINQLTLKVNNSVLSNFSSSITNEGIDFNFDLTIDSSHEVFEIEAKGTNSAGSDSKTIFITRLFEEEEEEEEPNCMPVVSAEFSEDALSVTANSDKDLSNVVLKYYDETTQKFEGLNQKSQSFEGTGNNADKCIVGVWIKSGCNQSGDGPGYGEWVPNPNYEGQCESAPCETPVVEILSASNSESKSYEFKIKVTHVEPNEVDVTFNNKSINCSYSGNDNIFTCNVDLKEGNNSFIVTANGCETTSKVHDVLYEIPCEPISYNLIYPSGQEYSTSESKVNINLTVANVKLNGISATVNGASVVPSLSGNSLILENVQLQEGNNNVSINLTNECSQETIDYGIVYELPEPCGTRINPGNSKWQFCLVTPSGTYNREDLQDDNFSYSGPASSVYFLPIAGGGEATVNGSPFNLSNGNYYLFEGNLTVEVSSQKPGAMGHWIVCVDSDSNPQSGKGNKRPQSPCKEKSAPQESPERSGGRSTTPNRGVNTNKSPTRTAPNRESRPSRTTTPSGEAKPTRNQNRINTPRNIDSGSSGNSNSNSKPTRTRTSRSIKGRD